MECHLCLGACAFVGRAESRVPGAACGGWAAAARRRRRAAAGPRAALPSQNMSERYAAYGMRNERDLERPGPGGGARARLPRGARGRGTGGGGGPAQAYS